MLTQVVKTFPSIRIPSQSGGLPVEVSLIAQLGHGAGDHLFESVVARQRAHQSFVDELDEPSARLGGVDFAKGDPTSLYSFVVGAKGHPFHRHAGHRVFTAISGSGGAQLRFSSAAPDEIEARPQRFIDALRFVNIPPDSLFTVRFGGDTWHQFAPLRSKAQHPAFFALSCHTNELGGSLPEAVRAQVLANAATIPALTELLPSSVIQAMQNAEFDPAGIPTVTLSLDAPGGSMQSLICRVVRGSTGLLRGVWARWRGSMGFSTANDSVHPVHQLATPRPGSLLLDQFAGSGHQHEDSFCLKLDSTEVQGRSASSLLVDLLDGFLNNRPVGVTRMMALRNVLVRPLGLRTSPLGCPVSSLLSQQPCERFAQRFPVIAQAIDAADRRAQVILGADDKHLRFRSCVGVSISDDGSAEFTLGTRVQYRNLFGRLYMALIDRAHRSYVTPTMMRLAADYAGSRSRHAATFRGDAVAVV
jgi:hypothetical protein